MRAIRVTAGVGVVLWLLVVCGCGGKVRIDRALPTGGGGGSAGSGGSGGSSAVCEATDKVDVLLAIDNSRSMYDKQAMFSEVVPYLISRLVNPRCVDAQGLPASAQPQSPEEPCPVAGTEREMAPVTDMHVGIVSTSLGGHGSDVCDPANEPTNDDHGRLVDRSGQSYQDYGFLAWDPQATHDPPGQSSAQALGEDFKDMVDAVGELGCGYEATLESWYRFLIQPDPWESVERQGSTAVLAGDDIVLLEQRKHFLRPDSLLVIVMLSDENDCSIKDGGIHWMVGQQQMGGGVFHLPRPTAECAANPDDPCCYSCGQTNPPSGCNTADDDCSSALTVYEDNGNVRCYDQKRRFGIDFLYPTGRYVDGLTAATVPDRTGEPGAYEPNPIFQDLNPDDDLTAIRNEASVFLVGIVGVPWQDIARRNAAGAPDLASGLDAAGNPVGGFQSGAELGANQTWDLILGEPALYHTEASARPADPLMWESVGPRDNTAVPQAPPGPLRYWDPPAAEHPVTGEPIGVSPSANSVNGHEYADGVGAQQYNNDLQYSCIFPLAVPRDCSGSNPPMRCACVEPDNDNPLCVESHGSGDFGQTQYWAEAYPPIRQLEVIEALGEQGVLTSICPAELGDPQSAIYGYRAVVSAIIEPLRSCLQ